MVNKYIFDRFYDTELSREETVEWMKPGKTHNEKAQDRINLRGTVVRHFVGTETRYSSVLTLR